MRTAPRLSLIPPSAAGRRGARGTSVRPPAYGVGFIDAGAALRGQAGGGRLEQEADRAADRAIRAPEPERRDQPSPSAPGSTAQAAVTPAVPSAVGLGVDGPGRSLDGASRAFLEARFGHSFASVRVHDDARAAQSAAAVQADAYTVGSDIVFGAGQFRPHDSAGRRLLAHEAAHVVQQSGGGGGASGPALSPASVGIQRQPAQTSAAAPAFSVIQSTYLQLINGALAQMSGRIVESNTLVNTVVPILQAMLASAAWKDAQGVAHGGGAISHTLPSNTSVNLQLILDDNASPTLAGEFTAHGLTSGVMEIFIRRNSTADELAETLYHESMHLVSWLINRPTPAMTLPRRGSTGPSGAAASLDMARLSSQISAVRLWLDTLAQSVNPRRAAGAQISAADLDRMARWLVEEVEVRAETEVFRQAFGVQQALAQPGPIVLITTGPNWQINSAMVDRYVFDLSQVFLPTDRTGLTPTDRQSLATLMSILEGIFQSRVRHRFSPTPYIMGRGIPRAPFQWTPPPLTPPSSFGVPTLP